MICQLPTNFLEVVYSEASAWAHVELDIAEYQLWLFTVRLKPEVSEVLVTKAVKAFHVIIEGSGCTP